MSNFKKQIIMKFTKFFVAAFATVILASCGGEATTETTEVSADTVAVAPADTTAVVADSTAADSAKAE